MHLEKSYFNYQFLTFRAQYYFNETKALIARHKILTAFIICLLAPNVKNIQSIGVPFYVLIDPSVTFKAKFIDLVLLLFLLLAMTKAQSSFIKGGDFREYLYTLYIPSGIRNTIDFIILLLSLNIIWLAIFLGGGNILRGAEDSIFRYSQYCLYASTVFALCTFLLNFLYKKIAQETLTFFALLLLILISKQGNWLLNWGAGLSISLLCVIMLKKAQPCLRQNKILGRVYTSSAVRRPKGAICQHVSDSDVLIGVKSRDSLKNIFIIQLAVLRKNSISFVIRFTMCFILSLLMLKVLNAQETDDNRPGLVLILISLQSYLLSTLFALFEKEKLEHSLFHSIFPYQKYLQFLKELILIWAGLMLALIPVCLFCIFNVRNHLLLFIFIFGMNGVVLAINRFLYTQSLRFCLLSSLLNTVGCCVVQYAFLGTYYG